MCFVGNVVENDWNRQNVEVELWAPVVILFLIVSLSGSCDSLELTIHFCLTVKDLFAALVEVRERWSESDIRQKGVASSQRKDKATEAPSDFV